MIPAACAELRKKRYLAGTSRYQSNSFLRPYQLGYKHFLRLTSKEMLNVSALAYAQAAFPPACQNHCRAAAGQCAA
jgi:hypothetical protein